MGIQMFVPGNLSCCGALALHDSAPLVTVMLPQGAARQTGGVRGLRGLGGGIPGLRNRVDPQGCRNNRKGVARDRTAGVSSEALANRTGRPARAERAGEGVRERALRGAMQGPRLSTWRPFPGPSGSVCQCLSMPPRAKRGPTDSAEPRPSEMLPRPCTCEGADSVTCGSDQQDLANRRGCPTKCVPRATASPSPPPRPAPEFLRQRVQAGRGS
jgi:hypothetical protein